MNLLTHKARTQRVVICHTDYFFNKNSGTKKVVPTSSFSGDLGNWSDCEYERENYAKYCVDEHRELQKKTPVSTQSKLPPGSTQCLHTSLVLQQEDENLPLELQPPPTHNCCIQPHHNLGLSPSRFIRIRDLL